MTTKQDQIIHYLMDIKGDVGGIKDHLHTLNGRVGRHEDEIAALQKTVWKWCGGLGGLFILFTFLNKFIIN